jgi:hypothetical protein
MSDQSEVKIFEQKLVESGLSWEHPRIQDYLKRVSKRNRQPQITRAKEIPSSYLGRLCCYLEIYTECERLLKESTLTWNSYEVRYFFEKYGDREVMPLQGWSELLDYLYEESFPF